MLKRIALCISVVLGLLLTTVPAFAQDVYVQGYFRSDGTYVQPHYRSAPNSTTLDNWSTKGNINPYTGEAGTRDPYAGSSGSYGVPNNSSGYSGYDAYGNPSTSYK